MANDLIRPETGIPEQASREAISFLSQMLLPYRSLDGKDLIRRALSAPERSSLKRRKDHLAARMGQGDRKAMMRAIVSMLAVFPSRGDADQTKAIVTAYVTAVHDLPTWAVEKSCLRFSRGEVRADEIGLAKMDSSFAPSAPQIRRVALDEMKPFTAELSMLRRALLADVEVDPLTSEDREALAAKFGGLKRELEQRCDVLIAERQASSERVIQRASAASARLIMREYEERGIAPPSDNPLSISMYLALGWKIEFYGDEQVLVRPENRREVIDGM